ncbi:hypothetical protein BJ508DRAFT_362190 [Ascobolus immersus RN42]|uniref:F-box domain-containing protein n=1 Tax=Ascobolus immersus RN42 TaxID=1160509 RepID=A0A3N4I4I5_ASCIM|nr:hypothetical protein BJ508DRAFT_362190 [Ascobolus immersus RN42]
MYNTSHASYVLLPSKSSTKPDHLSTTSPSTTTTTMVLDLFQASADNLPSILQLAVTLFLPAILIELHCSEGFPIPPPPTGLSRFMIPTPRYASIISTLSAKSLGISFPLWTENEPTKPPALFHFTQLPLELQLNIYDHCSAFTLLQLSRTTRSLRAEILRNPSVYTSSDGYSASPCHSHPEDVYPLLRCPSDCPSRQSPLTLSQINRIPTQPERALLGRLLTRQVEPENPGKLKVDWVGGRYSPGLRYWFVCGMSGGWGCGRLRWIAKERVGFYNRLNCECGRRGGLEPILGRMGVLGGDGVT